MKNPEKQIEINPITPHSMKCPKLYGEDCKCDGYHTFDELYEHRTELFITLCRQRTQFLKQDCQCWRSKFHSDGSNFKDWFILGIGEMKDEQITYHIPLSYWKETNFAYTYKKAPEWDGHTSDDVLERLKNL